MNNIAKNSDVFSSLNEYLSKGDDSFIFTSEVETPLSEAEEEKTESKNNLEFNDEVKEDDISISNETVDLSKIDYNFIPTAKITTTKKRAGRNQAQSIPINDYLSVVDAVPPKRSRLNKSLAEACLEPSSEDFITSDEENIFVSKTRSGKSRVPLKKPPKSKVKTTRSTTKKGEHLSLEEAMAHALETLEEIEPPTTLPLPKAKNSRAKKTAISKVKHVHTDVDLTGGLIPPHSTSTARHVSIDVDLTGGATPPHSTSPLFQPRKKYIEPNIDLFDIDSVNVKLKIDEIIEVHTIRKHQKFLNIFKAIADGHKISINDVLIYNNSKRIHHDDTPHSIAYRASIFLTCRIKEKSDTVDSNEVFRRCRNENEIEIKVQSDKWRRPLTIKVSKVEKFRVAMDILAESVQFKVEQMQFIFDGDIVDVNVTPMELEFEGGEIIDCRID